MDSHKVADIYYTNSILMAPPYKLKLMLYQGCIRFIRLARLQSNKDLEKSIHYNYKAQAIINELIYSSTKGQPSPFIDLYHFLNNQLISFHIHKDSSYLDNAEEILTEIQDVWNQVIKKGTTTL